MILILGYYCHLLPIMQVIWVILTSIDKTLTQFFKCPFLSTKVALFQFWTIKRKSQFFLPLNCSWCTFYSWHTYILWASLLIIRFTIFDYYLPTILLQSSLRVWDGFKVKNEQMQSEVISHESFQSFERTP